MKKSIALSITIGSLIRKLSLSLMIVGYFLNPCLAQPKKVEIVNNPIVDNDRERITVRIKVKGEEDKPVMGLMDTDFSLFVGKFKGQEEQEVFFRTQDWKSPEETIPPPAYIIVLLDMSGSMAQADSRGTTKLQGAVDAIEKFTNLAAARGGNTQVAIVPFGEPGGKCPGYSVDNSTLDKFFSVNDAKLDNQLDNLTQLKPCASTNLYQPLDQATRFLSNTEDSRFYPPADSKQPEPRLSIILLSDGYHNKPNGKQDFERLTKLFKSNDKIIVHTLGYGLTPEELGKKYGLGRPATRKDIGRGRRKVPEAEFVDQDTLAEIARLTGGIAEFSGDSEEIAQNLQLFLNSLLGEYEISYREPHPERGAKRQVKVAVKSPVNNLQIISEPKPYTIGIFGRSLPLKTRLSMVLMILLFLGVGGIVPFWFWAKGLKAQAMEN